jgi:hypothetical protein
MKAFGSPVREEACVCVGDNEIEARRDRPSKRKNEKLGRRSGPRSRRQETTLRTLQSTGGWWRIRTRRTMRAETKMNAGSAKRGDSEPLRACL